MPDTSQILLACENLGVDVPGRQLIAGLDLELRRGELIAVLGQNGSGKTLALTTLAGLRAPGSGDVRLLGDDISGVPRQMAARHLALLPQVIDDIFPATVLDTALIGRHPHIGALRWESAHDYAIAAQALAAMGLEALHGRAILTLSGGERRRLAIAQVLAQAPDVYLLDEPTNHLDPQHQLDTLRVFRQAADEGAGIITSLHDVNLAVRFADRCLLLFGDGRWRLGESATVLNEETLSELFATRMESVAWRSRELFVATSDHPAL
ncbi:MAG: ABC transporter ATP-binding protein [Woeseiaceae bacterium]